MMGYRWEITNTMIWVGPEMLDLPPVYGKINVKWYPDYGVVVRKKVSGPYLILRSSSYSS